MDIKLEKLLNGYETSKLALEILQKELDEKKALVVEALKALPDHKAKTSTASFSLRVWTTYSYTKDVLNLSNQLKALQSLEVQTGKATIKSETFAPIMRVAKGNKGGEIE